MPENRMFNILILFNFSKVRYILVVLKSKFVDPCKKNQKKTFLIKSFKKKFILK